MSVRTILSWYLSFKMFEKISYSLIIKNLIKTAYFCDFFYIGAKIFIIAHHGFHHSVWQCLKYLGYEAYVYTHSPGRGPQLDPKKTRKPYFSRLYQKVDFVRLFSRLDIPPTESEAINRFQNPGWKYAWFRFSRKCRDPAFQLPKTCCCQRGYATHHRGAVPSGLYHWIPGSI